MGGAVSQHAQTKPASLNKKRPNQGQKSRCPPSDRRKKESRKSGGKNTLIKKKKWKKKRNESIGVLVRSERGKNRPALPHTRQPHAGRNKKIRDLKRPRCQCH